MESLSYRKRSQDQGDNFVYVANNQKFKQVTNAFDKYYGLKNYDEG